MANQIVITRQLVVVFLAVVVLLSAAVGFLLAQATNPGTATAGEAQAAAGGSKKVVKAVNGTTAAVEEATAELHDVKLFLGGSGSHVGKNAVTELDRIETNTDQIESNTSP